MLRRNYTRDKKRVLLAAIHPQSAVIKAVLEDVAETVEKDLKQEGLEEEIKKNYDAVICSFWQKVTGNMIQSTPTTLKDIVTLSVGFDHIDIDTAKKRKIIVINAAKGDICASTYSVAEHVFAFLFALVRKNRFSLVFLYELDVF
jgi:lactate dehydrogenase-like 2-hydroxyacid dehydrogenase